MAGPAEPAAFMSYVRFNDRHDDGQLSLFRERLAAEVRAQTGEKFAIFQDRNDIAWGQSWQQRIHEALDAVTLLLVIITPGLFRSRACRAEIQRFLEREPLLGRTDPARAEHVWPLDRAGLRRADHDRLGGNGPDPGGVRGNHGPADPKRGSALCQRVNCARS